MGIKNIGLSSLGLGPFSLPFLSQLNTTLRRYLELLAIHPSYQRQGLGALLLQSRLSQLPRNQAVQLESTPAGQGLYKKFGFEVVETLNCKGRDKEIPIPVMIRKPEEV